MNIFRNRLIQSGGSQSGTAVYIDGVRSTASRIDLDDVIPMPYMETDIFNSNDEPQCVVFNNELHVMGGYTHRTTHVKWNGTAWVSVSTLPTNNGMAVVVFDNKIYLFDSARYFYSWDGTQWTEEGQGASSLNYSYLRLVVFNNEIHSVHANSLYKWNGSNWTQLATLPYNRGESTATVYDGAIHFLGGSKPTYHYKWDGNNLSSVSTIPVSCAMGCSLVFEDKLHLFFDNNYNLYHYIWDGNSWSEGIEQLCGHGTQGVVFNDKIMLLGYLYSDFIEPLNSLKNTIVTT